MAGAGERERDLDIRLALISVVAEGGLIIRCTCHGARFVPLGGQASYDLDQFRELHARCPPDGQEVYAL